MDIPDISHCVPWPPDKGDRIRGYHPVRAFQPTIPAGIVCCSTPQDYARAVRELPAAGADPAIVAATRARFAWADNLAPLVAELAEIEGAASGHSRHDGAEVERISA